MLEWKDIAGTIAKVAPMLGSLLGGPVGATVGSIVSSALGVGNSADEVSIALSNPDTLVKLRAIESNRQIELQTLSMQVQSNQLAADTAQIQAVNQTMRDESKSEHWASWLWRPYCGFVLGTMIFGCYFVLPLLHIPVPVVPVEAYYTLGAVLGIASWFRGKAQADPTNPAQVKG